MGKSEKINLSEFLADIENEIDRMINITKKEVTAAVEKAMDEADIEFGKYQKIKIEKIFRDSMDQFYNDYSPSLYDRRGSLFNMLDIKYNEYGQVEDEDPSLLIDPSKAPTTRTGGSLFTQVFKQGWHGGASGIDKSKADVWWPHPSPGTPYYRSRGFTKKPKFYHKYGKWGSVAIKTEAPYNIFADKLAIASNGEMERKYDEIIVRHLDSEIPKALERLHSKYGFEWSVS